jgi:phosphohistidine phosphatase
MPKLSLLRHAKSSRDGSTRQDFDRPLSKRGLRDAPRMGELLRRRELVPDLVLCSSARRTRDTLELLFDDPKGRLPKVLHEDALYLATPTAMLARLRKVKAKVGHVMLIGHNPGLQALALDLIGHGERADIVALATKLPTCGLVVIDFEGEGWTALRPAAGRLRLYMAPRRLEE